MSTTFKTVQVMVGCGVSLVTWTNHPSCPTSSPVNTEMGDCPRVCRLGTN